MTKYNAIPCDNAGIYARKDDNPAMIELLLATLAALPVMKPTPHDNAGIAIDTRGSNVQSSTQRSEARLDTSTNFSFQLVLIFADGCIILSSLDD